MCPHPSLGIGVSTAMLTALNSLLAQALPTIPEHSSSGLPPGVKVVGGVVIVFGIPITAHLVHLLMKGAEVLEDETKRHHK